MKEEKQNTQINLIGADRLNRMGRGEKISEIVNTTKKGNLVVLQNGLTPDEQSELIETTMQNIEPDGFTGIDIKTLGEESSSTGRGGLMGKASSFLRGEPQEVENQLTVIGPESKLRTIENTEDILKLETE